MPHNCCTCIVWCCEKLWFVELSNVIIEQWNACKCSSEPGKRIPRITISYTVLQRKQNILYQRHVNNISHAHCAVLRISIIGKQTNANESASLWPTSLHRDDLVLYGGRPIKEHTYETFTPNQCCTARCVVYTARTVYGRVYVTARCPFVCLSVCLSVCLLLLADRRYRSTAAVAGRHSSTEFSSKCEQCHVDSWRRRLNVHLSCIASPRRVVSLWTRLDTPRCGESKCNIQRYATAMCGTASSVSVALVCKH